MFFTFLRSFNGHCQLEGEVKKSPFLSGLLLSVHALCLGQLGNHGKNDIKQCLQESHALGVKIKAARHVGRKCAKQSVWILLMRCIVTNIADPLIIC